VDHEKALERLYEAQQENEKLRAALAMSAALAFCPMEDAPRDRAVILVSPWQQVAVAKWDGSAWRYGPQPGETWDADYPLAWVPIDACGWVQ
jgi:hypothetical protein